MTDEKEKFDIEDIKDPEDIDIDEVVSENEAPKAEPEVAEEKVVDDEKDVLEKVVEEETAVEATEPKKEKTKKTGKKSWQKYLLIGILVALFVVGIGYGVYYFNQKQETANTTETAPPVTEEVVTEEPLADEFAYVNSEVGLNMRQTPDSKAKVLAIIPYGTKIVVLEEQTGWVKTNYENKDGWVAVEYTQTTNPLVYENDTYGFGFTFKSGWAGYKFIEANNSESTTVETYYVALPTTDKKWTEPGIPAGYASLFVMGVYTKAEWADMAGGEMLPAKLGESSKYVFTYLPAQAYATDLKLQYSEIKDIIETFETLK